MSRIFPWCARRRRGDDGIALVGVLLSMVVISLFLLASLAFALEQSKPARRDQDAKIAVAAAQAGLDEYISRLTADSNYWERGNVDAANPALTQTGTGQTIQGTGTSGARYRYWLLTTPTQIAQTGRIRLEVTGISGPDSSRTVTRKISADLAPKGFLSFIYLSDVEVVDPELLGDNPACGNYYYAGRSARTDCANIQWVGGDTVQGPLHSNDALQINGSVNFTSPSTETSWPATDGAGPTAKTWWGSQGFPLTGNPPRYAPALSLPTANAELLKYVNPDIDGDGTTGPGCYYKGATRIRFTGTTMRVYSPSTDTAGTPASCFNTSNRAVEQTVNIPPVIYVDSTSSSCTYGATGYPQTNEDVTVGTATAVSWGRTTNYDCRRGSVYIQGNANDQVTVAAKDDVVVTGNLTLDDNATGTDLIGLIAGNYVWVYHPVRTDGTNLLSTHVTTIQAAILALRHSFVVQNWNEGAPLGTLNVMGAISQKFRGAVGTGSGSSISTGYFKNYVYDDRLAYLQPPYFLKPDSAPWQVAAVTDK